jgi:hypothetical protein
MAEAFLGLSGKDRLDARGVEADRLGRPAHLLEIPPKLGGGSSDPQQGRAVHLVFTVGPYDLYSGQWRTTCKSQRKSGNLHRSTPSH